MSEVVSVILPVFNQEKEVARSIESILQQSYPYIELIIVNDASEDATLAICEKYSATDNRIIILNNSENKGLPFCLNRGIAAAKGKYIARMDADDISKKERIEKQVKVFKSDPSVDVVGAGMYVYDIDGTFRGVKTPPISQEAMIKNIYKAPPFIHPTVMARKQFFLEVGGYNEFFKRAQDWELWSRTIYDYNFHNIDEPLIEYAMAKGLTLRGVFYHVIVSFLVAYRSRQIIKGFTYAGFSTSIKLIRLLQRKVNEKF